MGKIRKKLKDVLGFDTRQDIREQTEDTKKKISTFLADNPNLVVAVLDPVTDVVVVGFQDLLTANRVVAKSTGKASGMIADVLQYNKEDASTVDSMNQLLLILDGSIHTIAKQLAEKTKVAYSIKKED